MTESEKDTKERILEAATEVFGEHGYKAATIREICRRADANVAAINYHFNNKESLYIAVIERLFLSPPGAPPEALTDTVSGETVPPEERLRGFIRNLFLRTGGGEPGAAAESRARLMMKELMEPTEALDHVVEKFVKPHKEALTRVVSELLGPGTADYRRDAETLARCVFSIIGQCNHYLFARHVIRRVESGFTPTPEKLERLIDHITHFSLGGIAAVRDAVEPPKPKTPVTERIEP